jgi:uncharacterized protein (TIGR04255 family)
VKYQREQLSNPPLIEAMFEIRAACQTSSNLIPGAISERLKERFPVAESGGIVLGTDGSQIGVMQRFLNGERTRLVQCGPDLFTVNVLGDYGEFPAFAAMIKEALGAFYAVAKPTKLRRLGIRYINFLPAESIAAAGTKPLRIEATFPTEILPSKYDIALRSAFEFPKENGVLGLAVANPHQLTDGRRGCLLDLDFFVENPTFLAVDDCLPWARQAHDVIYDAFRSVLSTEMYKQLGPTGKTHA